MYPNTTDLRCLIASDWCTFNMYICYTTSTWLQPNCTVRLCVNSALHRCNQVGVVCALYHSDILNWHTIHIISPLLLICLSVLVLDWPCRSIFLCRFENLNRGQRPICLGFEFHCTEQGEPVRDTWGHGVQGKFFAYLTPCLLSHCNSWPTSSSNSSTSSFS